MGSWAGFIHWKIIQIIQKVTTDLILPLTPCLVVLIDVGHVFWQLCQPTFVSSQPKLMLVTQPINQVLMVIVVRMNTGILSTPRVLRYARTDQLCWGHRLALPGGPSSAPYCVYAFCFQWEGCHLTLSHHQKMAQSSAQRSLRHVHILTRASSCRRQNLDSSSFIMFLHMFNCQSGTRKVAPGGTRGSKQDSVTTAK